LSYLHERKAAQGSKVTEAAETVPPAHGLDHHAELVVDVSMAVAKGVAQAQL
jgi:hypothetical protein